MGKIFGFCLGSVLCFSLPALASGIDPACANQLKKVVTRFAPSPTGRLHIGGARTALFNYLYAKHTGGTFLLRIEDTDKERSQPEYVDSIVESLKWLGIQWEGEPVIQSARAERHREVAESLVQQGLAYYCYLTSEELDKMRRFGKKIESPWRDRDPKTAPAGVKPVIRLKAKREGSTVVRDTVQGTIRFPNDNLDDMILVRSDGSPTYNFAVVVDDHDMGVTNIIRGVDHLTNAARQTLLYEALGWTPPAFAHVPLIHAAGGKKLSKRDGALGAPELRDMGYLPESLRNYLARLGWSHGNDEIFTTEEAVKWFDIRNVSKSPARLDMAKLAAINRHYLREADTDELITLIKEMIPAQKAAELEQNGGWEKLKSVMPGLQLRANTLSELFERGSFIWEPRPIAIEDAAKSILDESARARLRGLLAELNSIPTWDTASIEHTLRSWTASQGADLSQIGQPLRVALTGSTVGLPLFDLMTVLGREEVLGRIQDQL